mmetsp:Transcript_22819/g.65206  ORF Transcript_22819/g.65206 Transcript_22819/m.65206 type:complete len:81 (-) Transcript_22819:5129-5371(-)
MDNASDTFGEMTDKFTRARIDPIEENVEVVPSRMTCDDRDIIHISSNAELYLLYVTPTPNLCKVRLYCCAHIGSSDISEM